MPKFDDKRYARNIKNRIESRRICQNCGKIHNVFSFNDHPVTKDGWIIRCVDCYDNTEIIDVK